jgi:NAD(P)-dependent dehydrogenase (short-subunit alcohol dehydrogenase family)
MDLEVAQKVFLITGGSSGLGRATAERLVREGARVALLAREADRVHAAATALRAAGGEAIAEPGDVRSAQDLARLVDAASARWGRIDGVLNNAGSLAGGSFADHDDGVWDADLSVKLMGAIRLVRLVLPALRASRGAIVNTLSVSGKAPEAHTTPTSISRAAGLALTKALSKELAPDGIRVNAVLVGVIESGQTRRGAAAVGSELEAHHARLVADYGVPLGRVGRAEEFADLAAFLLSPRAAYVTGAGVNLDGGLCPVA